MVPCPPIRDQLKGFTPSLGPHKTITPTDDSKIEFHFIGKLTAVRFIKQQESTTGNKSQVSERYGYKERDVDMGSPAAWKVDHNSMKTAVWTDGPAQFLSIFWTGTQMKLS